MLQIIGNFFSDTIKKQMKYTVSERFTDTFSINILR